ncbi:MAG: rod shape-determining protein [Opitutales bacterium]|nr:rod shape-determining protein [Opitutales bacterium]
MSSNTAAETILVGFDWGTNSSCIMASTTGSNDLLTNEIIPSIVGYAKEGLLEGILPSDKTVLFGKEALKYRIYCQLQRPMRNGVIDDLKSASDYAGHIKEHLPEGREYRAVIGVPARADQIARENVRTAVKGVFDKVILIPEPFLAALGYRDESRLKEDGYIDPVNNSLFIDIGAGSSDLCLVQGYYPQPDDQISIPYAGDAVDAELSKEILQKYPDSDLSIHSVIEIKEEHAYMGPQKSDIIVKKIIGGKPRTLDIGYEIGQSTLTLLDLIFEGVKQEIAKANPDSVPELLQNIVLTGGGSQIKNFAEVLQKMLEDDGYEQPKVRIIGENYKEFVAKGAMKAARAAKERQWQTLID